MTGCTLLISIAFLLAAGARDPVVDRSGFASVALLPDHKTVAFAYRVLRYRPGGIGLWFSKGRPDEYFDDRVVIATCPVSGGAPRILLRFENPFLHGTDGVFVTAERVNPPQLLLSWGGQSAPSYLTKRRFWRIDIGSGNAHPYPDLLDELARSGRRTGRLGCKGFDGIKLLHADGTLLICARIGESEELLLRRPSGQYEVLDQIEVFYGMVGDEAYYFTPQRDAVVRNWNTGVARIVSRFDGRYQFTLIPHDPTVEGFQESVTGPLLGATLSSRDGITFDARGVDGAWTHQPIPVDVAAVRR